MNASARKRKTTLRRRNYTLAKVKQIMTLCEITFWISDRGELLIPAETIADMGLKPGDPIHVAYLSSDGASNEFREFLLTQNGMEQIGEDISSIQIPLQLLEQANIPSDADVQIMCLDGMLLICRSASLDLEDMKEIFQRLKKAQQFSDYYGYEGDLENVSKQLVSVIEQLQEEEDDRECLMGKPDPADNAQANE